MIVLVDLDGTLVDRGAAFSTWAHRFIADLGTGPDGERDHEWLLASDTDGYTPRADLATAMKVRFGLHAGVPDLVEQLLFEHLQHLQPYPGVPAALRALTGAGAVIVVVTNGSTAQQTLKMDVTGLGDLVHGTVISEAVGAKKPDPAIFQAALAAAAGRGGSGPVWMVGDHPVADIGGGRSCGMRTGWVSHHRAWGAGDAPDMTAPTTADVLGRIAATGNC